MNGFISRINHFVKSIGKHNLSAYAAQTAFFVLLAFFPFCMIVLEALKYLPFDKEEFSSLILSVTPASIGTAVENIINELYSKQAKLIPISAFAALWSSSKGIYSLMRGLNEVYECNERRNYFKRRACAILYTVVFIAALVFTIGLMLIGEWFIEETIVKFGFKAMLVAVKMISQAVVLSLLFTVIYYFFPADKTVFSVHLPGAVLSACGWVIFTELYSIYVSLTDTGIYGSLSTVMLTMLWLYICMYILLIGGEINVSLQKIRNG